MITQDRLVEVLEYCESTGIFTWTNASKFHPRMNGKVAGAIATGYVVIKIDGEKYKAHRLAWLYVNGELPDLDIDHVNGCPLDNRIDNLRVATNPQNQANRKRNKGKELSKGVRITASGKFKARISVNKKQIDLGNFRSEIEAAMCYEYAARHHYGEFSRAS